MKTRFEMQFEFDRYHTIVTCWIVKTFHESPSFTFFFRHHLKKIIKSSWPCWTQEDIFKDMKTSLGCRKWEVLRKCDMDESYIGAYKRNKLPLSAFKSIFAVDEDSSPILIIENYFKCLSRRSKSVFGKMNLDSNGKIDFSSAGDL